MVYKNLVLGIDTSNYMTSVSIINNNGDIVFDNRIPLYVKKGELGLRQSVAVFLHLKNLEILIEDAFKSNTGELLSAVAVSEKPRNQEGSYMPSFETGKTFGIGISNALGIPIFKFSHQEGHIEAVKNYSKFKNANSILCLHLSGGTCEVLSVLNDKVEIIGGSKDISIGQLFDRVGASLGYSFPAGKELDLIALSNTASNILPKINQWDMKFNLSGIETKALRNLNEKGLVPELFSRVTDLLIEVVYAAIKTTSIENIIMVGGVSNSIYIREKLTKEFGNKIVFDQNNLSGDNAVGIGLLGVKSLWQ